MSRSMSDFLVRIGTMATGRLEHDLQVALFGILLSSHGLGWPILNARPCIHTWSCPHAKNKRYRPMEESNMTAAIVDSTIQSTPPCTFLHQYFGGVCSSCSKMRDFSAHVVTLSHSKLEQAGPGQRFAGTHFVCRRSWMAGTSAGPESASPKVLCDTSFPCPPTVIVGPCAGFRPTGFLGAGTQFVSKLPLICTPEYVHGGLFCPTAIPTISTASKAA